MNRLSYANFRSKAFRLVNFRSPEGTIYKVTGSTGDQLSYQRPGKLKPEPLDLIKVYEAYKQIEDYTTESFRPFTNGKQSPARALLLELKMIVRQN